MDNFKKNQGRLFTELGDWLNIKCEKWKEARKTYTLQIEKMYRILFHSLS